MSRWKGCNDLRANNYLIQEYSGWSFDELFFPFCLELSVRNEKRIRYKRSLLEVRMA
jgi:hypothetical protein